MSSGKYRTRVVAERLDVVQDGAGGVVSQWTRFAEFWANVEPISGREAMRANQLLADMDTRVTTRWTAAASGIHARDRLVVAGVPYSIVRPPMDLRTRHREIEIMCNLGLNDG